MNPTYPEYARNVGKALSATADAPATLANIYQSTVDQATLLSYLDDFKLLGLFLLGMLPLLLLVKPGKGGAAGTAH
jgi:hypothetical protein